MRLIETTTLVMENHLGQFIPPYAILSHTWGDEEVTFQDWNSPKRDRMKGFDKIRMTCWLAASGGIKYAWVDTCCIDKSDSAELSEAINSMYRWYKNAKVCYAYLSDLYLSSPVSERFLSLNLMRLLRRCRWFSRGWTLQELIAPASVLFYQHDWGFVGTKADWKVMLSDVTGISPNALQYYQPGDYSIAERMSWAGGRETTRKEDMAYCLVGIFDVNIPMLYGEGTKAFRRLQEEIIRSAYDVSIFAWTRHRRYTQPTRNDRQDHGSAFAEAPEDFHLKTRHLIRQWNEVSVTNAGVKLTLDLCVAQMGQRGELTYVLPVCTGYWREEHWKQRVPGLGVGLKMISPGRFVRHGLQELVEIPDQDEACMVRRTYPNAYLLTDISADVDIRMLMNLSTHGLHCLHFRFPRHCRVVKAWPSVSWNDAEGKFMTDVGEPSYGSFLLETQSFMQADDGIAGKCRTGEFMFIFSNLPDSNDGGIDVSDQVLQYTIVGYREYQLVLDSINLRIGAGDIDVREMRRTLKNFAIPRQQAAAVPVDGTGEYVYTSVEVDLVTDEVGKRSGNKCFAYLAGPRTRSFVFKSSSAAS